MNSPTLNRLAAETSPYLLQHASNPVDWYPWCAAALERARAENKPILLSIGYSACHWCHVMAHESFEDPAIAAVMNEHFINIKVDREERPDIDKIYQLAQQILTQRAGGWPLTMFLTPTDHQPFFGGTYFPPSPRHGLPGFAELLTRVASYYHENQDSIRQQTEALQRVFNELQPEPTHNSELHDEPLRLARESLEAQFDKQFGGFGGAPKFPHARTIEFLLRRWRATAGQEQPDLHALFMSALTLTRMAEGGLYDQLGGGFFRYSVDQYWMIPHFEKMLYDNAELLRVYAIAATACGEPLFKRVIQESAAWLLRDMRSQEGAFYSTWDADSEGHEGKYYVWDAAQVQHLLPADEYEVFAKRFGLDEPPNFAEPHTEPKWHLHSYRSIDDVAKELQISAAETEHRLQHARQRLLALRSQRVPPGRDEKILTSWNGLAIAALMIASRSLNDAKLADAGSAALDEIRTHAVHEGRLWAVQAGGKAKFAAYLDDYAYLLDATLEALQTRWRDEDLSFAIELAEALLRDFADEERGGFYFTARDHEALIHRSKSFADEATPAGNAIAALALNRLGYLVGEPRYLEAAERTIRADWLALLHHPSAHPSLLMALEEQLSPPQLVIIRGKPSELIEWQQSLAQLYCPRRFVFAIPEDAVLPHALNMKAASSETVAYVCNGSVCDAPVNSLAALIALTR